MWKEAVRNDRAWVKQAMKEVNMQVRKVRPSFKDSWWVVMIVIIPRQWYNYFRKTISESGGGGYPPGASRGTFVCPEMNVSDRDQKILKIWAHNFEKQKSWSNLNFVFKPSIFFAHSDFVRVSLTHLMRSSELQCPVQCPWPSVTVFLKGLGS